jgi:hypothetical protein
MPQQKEVKQALPREALSYEQRKDLLIRSLQQSAPTIQEERVRIAVPTLSNLPPTKRKESAFNYSLCESIDYQRESLQAPLIEAPQPRSTNPLYTVD